VEWFPFFRFSLLLCVFNAVPGLNAPARSFATAKRRAKAEGAAPRAKTASASASAKSGGGSARSVEDTYQRKSPREHVLLRPEPYIGSVQEQQLPMWILGLCLASNQHSLFWGSLRVLMVCGTVCVCTDESGKKIVWSTVSYVPGLYQIFDEILVNAADNVHRPADHPMTSIRVDLDPVTNTITIANDGAGIPVVMHAKEKVHVPELIFAHLLTSSNYDDQMKRFTGMHQLPRTLRACPCFRLLRPPLLLAP
jgi:DNA topoisomerase-2